MVHEQGPRNEVQDLQCINKGRKSRWLGPPAVGFKAESPMLYYLSGALAKGGGESL